jgi:hypothetical protein
MNDPLWHPKCPINQKATHLCLSHNCTHAPFQCQTPHCPCSSVHTRCKSMQLSAVRGYLTNWKKSICKEGQ